MQFMDSGCTVYAVDAKNAVDAVDTIYVYG